MSGAATIKTYARSRDLGHAKRRLRRRDAAWLAALMVLGAGLRFYRLDTGLWYDEIVTLVYSVRRPLEDIVSEFPGNNSHPLYSLLAHLSVSALGEGAWSLRLPAALMGIATIPTLYLLGTAVTNRREARAAAVLLTVSYHHVWFSQNARGYTALLFFALLGTFALVRWFDSGRRRFLLLYAVVTALGAYAHLTMVLVCVSQAVAAGVSWLSYRHRSRLTAEWAALVAAFCGAALLTVLLYAPMLDGVGRFFATQTASDSEVAKPLWAVGEALRGLQVGLGAIWAIALGGAFVLAGSWSYARERPTVAPLLLLPLPATILLAAILQRPVFPRFLFFGLGFVLLVAVRGAASLGASLARRTGLPSQQTATWIVAGLTVAGVGLSFRSLPYAYRYAKQDYTEAVAFVERSMDAGDRAIVVGATAGIPVREYLGRSWPQIQHPDQLGRLRQGGHHVWVLYTFSSYIQAQHPELWELLRADCREIQEIEGTVAGGSITIVWCP